MVTTWSVAKLTNMSIKITLLLQVCIVSSLLLCCHAQGTRTGNTLDSSNLNNRTGSDNLSSSFSGSQGFSFKYLLSIIAVAWYLIIWSICLLGLSVARSYFLAPPPPLLSAASSPDLPGVTILRPLSGLDCNLYSNLCSSFSQTYPADKFQVILSIREQDSVEAQKVLSIVEQVRTTFPHISSTVVIGDEPVGVNPKINNLIRPYSIARYDLVWIVDSQVWLPDGALGRAVMQFTNRIQPTPSPQLLGRRPHGSRIGFVHHVPLAVLPNTSWGSHVERVFLSTTHAKMYLAINALAIDSCVMGKSNMYRRSDLAQVPDSFFPSSPSLPSTVSSISRPLARFGIYLNEDNMVALSIWRSPLSLTHIVARNDVAHTAVGDIFSMNDYLSRRIRWIRVRRHTALAATIIEPFTESILASLVGWFGLSHTFFSSSSSSSCYSITCLFFFSFHFIAWFITDFQVFHALNRERRADNRGGGQDVDLFSFIISWWIREILAFPIWILAISGSTVSWRNKTYKVLSDGRGSLIPESKKNRSDSEPLLS